MTVSARWRRAACAAVTAVLAGCGSGGSAHAPAPAGPPDLSPAQLAGQRVIYSYQGLTPPAGLLALIRHGEAAGVIFFSGNIASAPQIAGVISALDQASASPDNPLRALPLLLMTDQEGGPVRRLPGPPLLSEKQSAGMDLILCSSQDLNQGEQARIALQQDLTSGTLNHAAFMAAVERIVSLRSSLRR